MDRDRETPPPVKYSDLQARAVDACKLGGDPQLAQVYATLALAEAVRGMDLWASLSNVATAIDGLGTSVERAL